MNAAYPATYRDKHGEEITTIQNDGKLLSMVVRGVPFVGDDFDFMAAAGAADSSQLALFTFAAGYLCDCEIECAMPLDAVVHNQAVPGVLHIHLKLGPLRSDGRVEYETLQLRFDVEGNSYRSCGQHGWFEDELIEIQKVLPEGVYLKCCFNCAYSDYSPAGSGLFGDMVCFRDNKPGYLQVQDKYDLFRIWDTLTEKVQETYLCPEFEKRVPGTGYRG